MSSANKSLLWRQSRPISERLPDFSEDWFCHFYEFLFCFEKWVWDSTFSGLFPSHDEKYPFNHVKRTLAGRYPSFSSPLSDHWIPSPCSGPETTARSWPLKISSFCLCSIQSFCTERHMAEVPGLRSDLMNEEYYAHTHSLQRWRLLNFVTRQVNSVTWQSVWKLFIQPSFRTLFQNYAKWQTFQKPENKYDIKAWVDLGGLGWTWLPHICLLFVWQ